MTLDSAITTIIISLIVGTLTFLVGALWSENKWMGKFGDRLTKLETERKNDRENFEKAINVMTDLLEALSSTVKDLRIDVPPCSFHIELDKRVVTLEAQTQQRLKN